MPSTRTLLLAACAAGLAAVATHAKDCVCKSKWFHQEGRCGKGGGSVQFNGCPALEDLARCDVDPQQSWCETTEDDCDQQDGDSMVNQTWAYCNPQTGATELPYCECRSKWTHQEGACQKGGATMQGCPTLEKLSQCEDAAKDAYEYGNMSWCDTTHDRCLQQVNVKDSAEVMVGEGWAMCDADTQLTELPDCECQETWYPDSNCAGANAGETFEGCTAYNQYMQKCSYGPLTRLHNQAFCKVKNAPCKQQSLSNTASASKDGVSDMVGTAYTYCDVETWEPEFPQCRCKSEWYNKDADCSESGKSIKMTGCPSAGDLRKCDDSVQDDEEYCETTYKACDEQGYEADEDAESRTLGDGGGWSYCDSDSGEAEYPVCSCMSDWKYSVTKGTTYGVSAECAKMRLRGCPTLEQFKKCEPDADASDIWCDTKDMYCRGQDSESDGKGWMYCNPDTQFSNQGQGSSVGAAVGITFVMTVIFCTLVFIGFLYAYKQYLNHHKKGYSQELLQS